MKNLKTNWLIKHTLTVFSCVLIIVLGIAFLSQADPVTTTIGENIATNDLSVTGNVTAGTWQGTAIETQYGGTGADWSAVAQGNLPYFSAEGALSNLAPGTDGQFLKSQGDGADPAWANVTRSATFVVAADDSSTLSKQQADYVCDGTDDQVEIQAAIDALPSGGGKVVLMEGEYNLGIVAGDHCITLKSKVWLQGTGKYITKLFVENGVQKNAIGAVTATNIIISDLEIDGNKTNNVETGPCADSKQNNIYFSNVQYSRIYNVYSHDAIYHGIFNFSNGSYNSFSNNELAFNDYRPIHAHSNVNNNYYGQNYIHDNGTVGGSTYGGLFVIYDGASDNIIEGNIIEDENSIAGIHIAGGTAAANRNTIIGNTIYISDTNTHGILFQTGAGGYGTSNTVISGNTIRGGRHGILFEAGTHTNVSITGNYIYAYVKGIYGVSATQNLQITGNTIIASGEEAINFLGGTTRTIISNNFLKAHSTWAAMKLKNSTYNIIESNIFYTSKWAIDETTGAGNSNNIIRNNNAQTIAQSPTYALEADDMTRATGNNGYTTENSGTSTITAAQTSIDVTHSLVSTPSRIQLTPTTDTAGKRYWISAKGATTFTITIDSTHTSDISFDWRAAVGEGN